MRVSKALTLARAFVRGQWRAALPVLLLLQALAACTAVTPEEDIDVPTPRVDAEVVYTDTMTVRTSTALDDSVPSSTAAYLLTGRYADARLGVITARSYAQLGLGGVFAPSTGQVYDSLVLTLTADAYRYGDTTRTQQLLVHRLTTNFRAGQTYYTADALPYGAVPLGQRAFQARARLGTLRVRLSDNLGQELWRAGRDGQLTTDDELRARLPGLVIGPAATDDAALVRWLAAGNTLHLYYHDPGAPTVALGHDFVVAGGNAHFYQLHADRTRTLLANLTTRERAISSSATANETYIQAGLGLKTRVDFPFLARFKDGDATIALNSVKMLVEVVTNTERRFFPPPATLIPTLADRANHSVSYLLDVTGAPISLPYQRSVSTRTGLEQGSYNMDLTAYASQVLQGRLPNQGILLGAEASPGTEGVVIGGVSNSAHPLKLQVYYTRFIKP